MMSTSASTTTIRVAANATATIYVTSILIIDDISTCYDIDVVLEFVCKSTLSLGDSSPTAGK
jgi:hypothetical protein